MFNAAINETVNSIQHSITVSQLPRHMQAIMNMWVRTGTWYDIDGVAKFERCLQKIVSREMMRQLLTLLVEQKGENTISALDKTDLISALKCAQNYLRSGLWTDMNNKLFAEACRIVVKNKVCVLSSDDGLFVYHDNIFNILRYNLPHVQKSLETLPDDFKYEIDYMCPICLEVDAAVPTFVRTECNHIFHKACFRSWYCKFLEEDTSDKKYCSCPICRTDVKC
jgi:hypothetical protein